MQLTLLTETFVTTPRRHPLGSIQNVVNADLFPVDKHIFGLCSEIMIRRLSQLIWNNQSIQFGYENIHHCFTMMWEMIEYMYPGILLLIYLPSFCLSMIPNIQSKPLCSSLIRWKNTTSDIHVLLCWLEHVLRGKGHGWWSIIHNDDNNEHMLRNYILALTSYSTQSQRQIVSITFESPFTIWRIGSGIVE